MKKLLAFLFFCSGIQIAKAQNVGVGTVTPDFPFTVQTEFDGATFTGRGIAQEAGPVSVGFYCSPGLGAYVQTWSPDDLNFSTNNGLPKMTLANSSGYLGINTTSPQAQLDLHGSLRLNITGTGAGKFLTCTNSSGDAQWQSLPPLALPYAGSSANTGTLFSVTGSTVSNGVSIYGGSSSAVNGTTMTGSTGVYGELTATSGGAFSAGLRGINRSTTGLGIGVVGYQAGSGYGVYGETGAAGTGVYGTAPAGGVAIQGVSTAGTAGRFTSSNAALFTAGPLQLTGISEATGKVLTSNDAAGNASWQALPGAVNFSATQSIGITVPNITFTLIPFSTSVYNSGFTFSAGTLTIQTAGIYHLETDEASEAVIASAGAVGIELRVNGTAVRRMDVKFGAGDPLPVLNIGCDLKLAVGNTVTVYIYQSSGSSFVIGGTADAGNPHLTVHRVN